MQLILLSKVKNLGNLGDTVKVRPGYGRNFLVPKGLALSATKANIAYFEERKAELQRQHAATLGAAQARFDAIVALGSVTIAANVGEENRLYGSVGPQEIADAITMRGIEITKRDVRCQPLRQIGEHRVNIHLHTEMEATITVNVVPVKG